MFKTAVLCLVEDLIRHISGPLGVRLRRYWYRWRLRKCGSGLVIEPGVFLVNPSYIEVGTNTWIDRQVTLIGGLTRADAQVELRGDHSSELGTICLGSNCHIGIGTIIQGHGGVKIGDACTTSPHVKIYSLSNDYKRCQNGTIDTDATYILTPVYIGRNVWIGINSIVIGHVMGDNVFVKPGSVIALDVPSNTLVSGNPARVIGKRFQTTPMKLIESV